MRRSRAVDWWLLATLLPLYLLLQAAGIHAYLSSGSRSLPFSISGAQGERGYPIVWGPGASGSTIQRGDRVLRLGGLVKALAGRCQRPSPWASVSPPGTPTGLAE